jgi:hypothetical protein
MPMQKTATKLNFPQADFFQTKTQYFVNYLSALLQTPLA